MENAGNSGAVNKKFWIILFSVLGVLIVGLVIAIVVVLVMRGGNPTEPVHSDLSNEEALRKEFDVTNEIREEVEDWVYNPDELLASYLQKIRNEKDEKTRLLLSKDYYYYLSIFGNGDDLEQQVLDGLIDIDNKLQMIDTALMIVNRAEYYGNEELKNKYNEIANSRLGVTEEEINAMIEEIQRETALEEQYDD